MAVGGIQDGCAFAGFSNPHIIGFQGGSDVKKSEKSVTEVLGWSVFLWATQVLLAVMFGMAGFMKVTTPTAALVLTMPWTASLPPLVVKFIGWCEIAGSLGLIFPSLFRIRPILTPIAAAALATLMVLAAAFHISRGESSIIGIHIILGSLAAFVAWGRSKYV